MTRVFSVHLPLIVPPPRHRHLCVPFSHASRMRVSTCCSRTRVSDVIRQSALSDVTAAEACDVDGFENAESTTFFSVPLILSFSPFVRFCFSVHRVSVFRTLLFSSFSSFVYLRLSHVLLVGGDGCVSLSTFLSHRCYAERPAAAENVPPNV